MPGFAAVSEFAYRFIAGHRELAQSAPPDCSGERMSGGRHISGRGAGSSARSGAIYLVAFLSFWVQADGLIGARGVLPLAQFLEAARRAARQRGPGSFCRRFAGSTRATPFSIFSAARARFFRFCSSLGLAPALCLVLLFVLYLSLTVAGQTFFSFQWDILLLETGFLAIFLAPWRWWPRRDRPAPLSRPRFSFSIFCSSN